MTAEKSVDPPVVAQTELELLQAELLLTKADNVAMRARLADHDKANAERAGNKQYLKLKDCAGKAGVTYSTAHRYHKRGELDSYVIPGTAEIMAELSDMIARRTRTGRHAKGQPLS